VEHRRQAQDTHGRTRQKGTVGLLTPADVIAASEKDRDAYLNKYWPDLEEQMLVQSLLKGKIV